MREIVEKMAETGWVVSSGSVSGPMCMIACTINEAKVMMTLERDGDDVRLHRLRAVPEFQGGGSQGLRELCAAADATDTTLLLKVQPFGSKALSEDGLVRIYEKCGFEPDPYSADFSGMVRYANRISLEMA